MRTTARNRAPAWGLALALLALLGLAACGAGSSPRHAASTGAAYKADQATWALPLDQFRVDPVVLSYASDLITAQCVTAKGFAPPTIRAASYQLPPTRNPQMRRLFDTGIAARYGYHSGPSGLGPSPLDSPTSPAERAAIQACDAVATKQLGSNQSGDNFVAGLAYTAEDTADASRAVKAAAVRWRVCMRPMGLSDLPSTPDDMPTASQDTRFRIHLSETSAVPDSPVASVAEIKAATFDARCRSSSGYSAAAYEAERAAELALIDQNAAALSRQASSVKQLDARVNAAIRKLGG